MGVLVRGKKPRGSVSAQVLGGHRRHPQGFPAGQTVSPTPRSQTAASHQLGRSITEAGLSPVLTSSTIGGSRLSDDNHLVPFSEQTYSPSNLQIKGEKQQTEKRKGERVLRVRQPGKVGRESGPFLVLLLWIWIFEIIWGWGVPSVDSRYS